MSKELKLNLPPAADLFSTEETRQDAKLECVLQIAPEELHPFRDHPFQVNCDAELQKLTDSIRDSGYHVAVDCPTKSRRRVRTHQRAPP